MNKHKNNSEYNETYHVKSLFQNQCFWLALIIGFLFVIAFIAILHSLSNVTGTSASATYDGERNMECDNVRVDHENIFKTYHYEMKCFPYNDTKEEKIR